MSEYIGVPGGDEYETVLTPSLSDVGKRADAYISEALGITRSAAVRLIENGNIVLLGKSFPKNYKLREGDVFSVELPEPEPYEVGAENIPLDVVFEDSDIIVVNKGVFYA